MAESAGFDLVSGFAFFVEVETRDWILAMRLPRLFFKVTICHLKMANSLIVPAGEANYECLEKDASFFLRRGRSYFPRR